MTSKDTVLLKPKDLYIDQVIDENCNESAFLLYNPDGYGGVVVVGQEIKDFVELCDGKSTISEILSKRELPNKKMLSLVEILVQKGFLIQNGLGTNHRSTFRRVLTCWLHITNACNLACPYCYIHRSQENMSEETLMLSIEKMIESCINHNYEALVLMFVGGEPLTRFDVIKNAIAYCEENNHGLPIQYIIPTNGTLLTPEIAHYIKKKHISVGVSLDGSKTFHDLTRVKKDGSGSYDMVMRGISNLINCNIKPSIMVTVTQHNLDGLESLTRELIDKQLYFRFSLERDTQTGMPSILDDEDKCISILNKCFDIMDEALTVGKLGWYFKFGDVSFSKPVRRSCAAGKNFFAIGQDGTLGSCSLGLEKSQSSIYQLNDVIDDIADMFSLISKSSSCDIEDCMNCLWRHSCAGACPLQTFATYQTYLHASPFCRIYRECMPRVIRIYARSIYYKNTNRKEE